jgi:hypothetical protein
VVAVSITRIAPLVLLRQAWTTPLASGTLATAAVVENTRTTDMAVPMMIFRISPTFVDFLPNRQSTT